jgi:alkylation response protein AidB-like acyl-CoA dehydrogenase
MVFVMCRTDPEAANRYRGLSFALVDFLSNAGNIEFLPIRQLTGDVEIYPTFFDGARAPLFGIIGGLDNGWTVAMTTLENERSGRARSTGGAEPPGAGCISPSRNRSARRGISAWGQWRSRSSASLR